MTSLVSIGVTVRAPGDVTGAAEAGKVIPMANAAIVAASQICLRLGFNLEFVIERDATVK